MSTMDTAATQEAMVGQDLIVQLAFGSMASQTLRAALRLGVFDLIGVGRRPAGEVAADAGAEHQPMTRLLRALAGLGLMEEHKLDTFSVTAAGSLLDSSRPDSLVSFVRMFTDPAIVRAWDGLDSSVRTGGTAFDAVFGTDFFSYLGRHPELSADFNAAMSQASEETAAVLPHAYDFGRFTSVTDVGGGDGSVLAGILAAHPALTGVLHDTKDGLAQAPKTLDRHGVADRCSLAAGDFFRSVPGGSDLYLIKSVLHDWSDDQAVTILGHCCEVLPPGGHVLIVEPVLPEVVGTGAAAHAADGGITYLSDLNMLVNLGGRERTRKDFEEVCHRAGLSVVSVTPLLEAAPFYLIETMAC